MGLGEKTLENTKQEHHKFLELHFYKSYPFLILSCIIFSALILQGGQSSLSLQLVKIALLITVLF
jgi:hypothetical protein